MSELSPDEADSVISAAIQNTNGIQHAQKDNARYGKTDFSIVFEDNNALNELYSSIGDYIEVKLHDKETNTLHITYEREDNTNQVIQKESLSEKDLEIFRQVIYDLPEIDRYISEDPQRTISIEPVYNTPTLRFKTTQSNAITLRKLRQIRYRHNVRVLPSEVYVYENNTNYAFNIPTDHNIQDIRTESIRHQLKSSKTRLNIQCPDCNTTNMHPSNKLVPSKLQKEGSLKQLYSCHNCGLAILDEPLDKILKTKIDLTENIHTINTKLSAILGIDPVVRRKNVQSIENSTIDAEYTYNNSSVFIINDKEQPTDTLALQRQNSPVFKYDPEDDTHKSPSKRDICEVCNVNNAEHTIEEFLSLQIYDNYNFTASLRICTTCKEEIEQDIITVLKETGNSSYIVSRQI